MDSPTEQGNFPFVNRDMKQALTIAEQGRRLRPQTERRRFRPTTLLLPFAVMGAMCSGTFAVAAAEPVVAGVASAKLPPALKGQILIEELNCVACHSGDPSLAASSKKAPRLAEIGSRLNPAYIEAFVRDPHGTKPGTTMPDLLAHVTDEEKKQVSTSLTHFLMSLKKNEFALQAPDVVAAAEGKRLFHSRGCAQCHSPRDDKGIELPMENSVPLGALEKKYSFKSLGAFLSQPHASRPSGRMPDMQLQGRDIERIAHFLLQDTRVPGSLNYKLYRGKVWEGLGSPEVKAERAGLVKDFSLENLGAVQQHTAIEFDGWLNVAHKGTYQFFLRMNGGSLNVDGKTIIEQQPSDRRGVKELEGAVELDSGWRRIQLTYFHTGPAAKFSCEMQGPQFTRQAIPSSMLSISDKIIPEYKPLEVDAALAQRGREHFEKIGCANCHDDLKVSGQLALPFAKLDSARGCLSDTTGKWPAYNLSAEQRGWIATALPQAEKPQLTDKQRLEKTLTTFNCIACHERDGLGGVTPARREYFTGTQPGLGDQGRLPPPLTHVGAKLQPEWMAEVLLRGGRQRDYLDASMPQFGEANIGHLVELFGKVDELEKVVVPQVASIKESKDAGYEMIGTKGFSCIACHEFNGQKAGEMSALDISNVTKRLKKNWFNLYMRQPSRFHPTVTMPSYWPGGQSIRPNLLGGNTDQQIEALWVYLEDGPRAKKPFGLSRQSNELSVSDVTEICRGRSSIGFRGIGVGYPERLNLAFDSGEMALRQLWKGEFANADMGSFSPRGTDNITFAPGIPFHRLKSLDDSWPYKGKTNHTFPQDQGYQFSGYHLDAARRPTFRFNYGDIKVEDFFEDVKDKDGKAYFKRTLRFETSAAALPFQFRAATGNKITTQANNTFLIDRLQLRITSSHTAQVREGNPAELLIPLTLPQGNSSLTLEYQW